MAIRGRNRNARYARMRDEAGDMIVIPLASILGGAEGPEYSSYLVIILTIPVNSPT